jgi:hypothetical protein
MRLDDEAKDVLDDIFKRFQTTIIGSLARFEENFGYLWENDNENSRAYYKLWQQTRNSVLNNGNNQARLALDELEDFLIDKTSSKYKYHYKFYFNKNQDNQGENR